MSISEPLTTSKEEEAHGFVFKAREDLSFDDVVNDFEMVAFGEFLNELTKTIACIEFLRFYSNVVHPAELAKHVKAQMANAINLTMKMVASHLKPLQLVIKTYPRSVLKVSLSHLKQGGGEGESQGFNLKIPEIILISSEGISSVQPLIFLPTSSTFVTIPSSESTFLATLPSTISNIVAFPVSTQFTKSIPLPLSKPLSIGSTDVTLMPSSSSEPSSLKGKEMMKVLRKN
ncbi:unnamed protein product [Lactuca saligna]|uniref:Uncharacterized protein n=1 Tax=Lactuca saligna TaxID=75948 RepID=A0AA36A2U5_LACSI|nr:unnamed protein product [Lactuca saligna]